MLLDLIKLIINHPLNLDDKIGAIINLVKWQIGIRLNPYPVIYPFTGNSKFIIWKGLIGATQNIYNGLDEFYDMGFLLHLLRPGDLFVDIGANVGSYTILASAEIGASTISIEPVPMTFQYLKNNILINDMQDRVELLNIGLGSSVGQIKFTESHDTMNHVATNEDKDVINVQVDTLDNVLKDRHPLLLKIDVEGFETEVLKGAQKGLIQKDLKAIIIELNGSGNRYGYDQEQIHSDLLKLEFVPYQYDPFKRNLSKISTFGSHNTIYIRDIDFVKDRISKARKFLVRGKEI